MLWLRLLTLEEGTRWFADANLMVVRAGLYDMHQV